jgi:hypothetical protein
MTLTKSIGVALTIASFVLANFGFRLNSSSATAVRRLTSRAEEEHCPAPAEWFPKTPAPTYSRPNRDSECDFYMWAWQTFLYITQPDPQGDGRPRFLSFETPTGLFGPNATPRFLKAVKKGTLLLAPRLEKEPLIGDLDSVLQAGSLGVLVDQNGKVVYYAQHINSVFVDFVKQNGYTDMSKLKDAPADQTFPKGSLELKSSWRIVVPGEDTSKVFTTKATVPLLVVKNGKIVIDPNKTREETVALLGLHVVGVVEGHPEFVWATFEHNDNAPNLKDMDAEAEAPVDSTRDWTLYAKGTWAQRSNKKPGKAPQPPLTFVDQNKQIMNPKVSVFRQFRFDDDEQIKDLNKSVQDQLPQNLAVWKNYSFMGAVWLNTPDRDFKLNLDFKKADDDQIKAHPEIGEDPAVRILGGERELSNTTMETFTQSTQSCFSCHKTTPEPVPGSEDAFPAKLLTVSHVLTGAYINSQQVSQRLNLKNKNK